MDYNYYYLQSADKALSAYEIRRATGLNPEIVGAVALEAAGVYPVVDAVQPFNTKLYDVVLSYTVAGGNATKSWTATAKTLADIIDNAKAQRVASVSGRMAALREVGGFGGRILLAAAAQLAADRAARFAPWVTRAIDTITELDTDLTAIEGAANVDAINDIVSPAHGTYALALDEANPLNLLAGDFDEFYSKNYAESDLELYFPSTTTTISYSAGFAATASVVTAADPTVQIRVAATGVVVDEFKLYTADSTDFASYPEKYVRGFGYRQYDQATEFEALY